MPTKRFGTDDDTRGLAVDSASSTFLVVTLPRLSMDLEPVEGAAGENVPVDLPRSDPREELLSKDLANAADASGRGGYEGTRAREPPTTSDG